MTNFRQGTELQTIHVCNVDPTIAPGIPGGTPNLLLLRTDVKSIYYFEGPLDTDWKLVGSAASGPTFPDIIDTPAVRVQSGNSLAGNNAGCKTVIGTPAGPPNAGDPVLFVGSNVGGSGADSFQVRDAGQGYLVRTRCDPNNGGSVTFLTGLSVVSYGLSGVSGNALTGVVNNHTWGGGLCQFQPAAPLTVTGIALTVPARNLNPIPMGMIQNFGPASVTLTHEDVASLEVNRFRLPGGAPYVLPAGAGAIVLWSPVPVSGGQRWMIMGSSN